MRLLVNYGKEDKGYLPALAYILKARNIQAVSTATTCTIGELQAKAEMAGCDAILLCNVETLRNCVSAKDPTLDAWRGSRLEYKIPIIVGNSLSHVHSVPHGEWLLKKDLDKLAYVKTPPANFSFVALTDAHMLREAMGFLHNCSLMSTDIETTTRSITDKQEIILSPNGEPIEVPPTFITCAGWTGMRNTGETQTFVLPFISMWQDHWEDDMDYGRALNFMRKVNASPAHKVMHNGMYDAFHYIRYHAEPHNWTLDTMAMAHAEHAELPKSLDFVASYHLPDYVYWKHDADAAKKEKNIQKYWAYNGQDTWYTLRIALSWLRNAPAYARKNYARKFFLVYPSLYCNFEGCKIDQADRTAKRAIALEAQTKAKSRLQTMVADPNFNPGSWQQVEKYVYQVFGGRKPKIGKSKSGTDEKNLKAVAEQHPILARFTDSILIYRENQKGIGTYMDFYQHKGRLLWGLNPYGTETERMACSASPMWCGTQVQNVPSYAKTMLVADEGFELFEIDNKQSEGRCTAYCAQDEALIAAIEDATRDFYKTLGTLFFNIPYEEVSDFFRNKVLKRIVHGTNYMMGGRTFIENIGARILFETAGKLGYRIVEIPRKNSVNEYTLSSFAKMLLDTYHKPFPRVREWYKEIYTEVATTGKLVSPLGHVRVFFGDISKNHAMLRGAVAHQPQNLSVEILNKGFKRIYQNLVLKHLGDIRLKAQIHDSNFGQYRISMRDYFLPLIQECCDNPVIVHGRTLSIPTDIKYGQNWAEKESDEVNPNGTRKWKGAKK
jgi:DNA polymerase I-like protein with 3'-5' exonuclease and polymerase domains